MATVLDEFTTRYRLDDQYSRRAADIGRATLALRAPLNLVLSSVRNLAGAFTHVAANLGGVIGIVGAGGIIGLGVSAVRAAADLESLKLALQTATGSAGAAEAVFQRLLEVAKLPGIGLSEAVQGFVQLFTVTRDAPFVIRMLTEFSNAIAAVGFGREELQRVIVNMTQILGLGKLMGDELRETAQLVPQFRTALTEAFGVADTEGLRKLGLDARQIIEGVLSVMERSGRAQAGLRVMFDNIADLWFQFLAKLGGTITTALQPIFDGVASALQALVDSDIFDRLRTRFVGAFDPDTVRAVVLNIVSWLAAIAEMLPQMIATIGKRIEAVLETVKRNFNVIVGLMTAIAALSLVNLIGGLIRVASAAQLAARAMALLAALTTPLGAVAAVLTGIGLGLLIDKVLGGRARNGPHDEATSWTDDLVARQRDIRQMLDRPVAPTRRDDTALSAIAGATATQARTLVDASVATARNTERLVEFEMRRIALGGGEIGRLGITRVEAHRIRFGTQTSTGTWRRVDAIAKSFAQALVDAYNAGAYEQALALRRAGAL